MDSLPLLLLLLLAAASRVVVGILTDGGLLLGDQLGEGDAGGARCARRVQRELDSMRRSASSRSGHAGLGMQPGQQGGATIDLTGYALHQPLRSAPYDMYVTGMHVRVPAQSGWVRVERCQFDARNHSLDTRLLFRDLTVTGHVKLYEDFHSLGQGVVPLQALPAGTCTMTLRLRRAGLGFTAVPAVPAVAAPGRHPGLPLPLAGFGRRDALGAAPAPLEVRTDARFVDPDFVSVYAHGCPSPTGGGLGHGSLIGGGLGHASLIGGGPARIEHRSDDVNGLDLPDEPSQDLSQQDNATWAEAARGRATARGLHRPSRQSQPTIPDRPEHQGVLEPQPQGRIQVDDGGRDLSGEMEDVFLRGIRTLLARYMERRLQPALRDTVMAGMGYSVSYGRR